MTERVPEDPEREERITMEIVVDAYGSDECAMGWYCYLEDKLKFPFKAHWRRASKSMSARPKTVTVTGMADSDECLKSMRVEVEDDGYLADVTLSKIDVIEGDDATRQAVADWHYWVNRGYSW
jgi:hypothetical protein